VCVCFNHSDVKAGRTPIIDECAHQAIEQAFSLHGTNEQRFIAALESSYKQHLANAFMEARLPSLKSAGRDVNDGKGADTHCCVVQ
jgi:hypothetical protein